MEHVGRDLAEILRASARRHGERCGKREQSVLNQVRIRALPGSGFPFPLPGG